MSERTLPNGARLVDLRTRAARERRAVWMQAMAVEFVSAWSPEHTVESGEEVLVLFMGGGGSMSQGDSRWEVPPYGVVLAPAGRYVIEPCPPGAVVLATDRPDMAAPEPEQERRSAPFRRLQPLAGPQVWAFDDIPFPPDNPRLKFLQSATMSVNLVIYDGPRDRSSLSPHAHADFWQGSMALEGRFVHHLRLPWGRDADEWCEDVHQEADEGELLLIPPGLIHTTEGVGRQRHYLIDVFAPPRPDFIARGWVVNAGDYAPPA